MDLTRDGKWTIIFRVIKSKITPISGWRKHRFHDRHESMAWPNGRRIIPPHAAIERDMIKWHTLFGCVLHEWFFAKMILERRPVRRKTNRRWMKRNGTKKQIQCFAGASGCDGGGKAHDIGEGAAVWRLLDQQMGWRPGSSHRKVRQRNFAEDQ